MSNRPLDRINIGYNKSNEEYIELLEEKNKIKKDLERQKEYQEKKKVAEREQGFNIYLSGANEARIKDQRKQELIKDIMPRGQSQQDIQQKGQRRMWRNASSSDKPNSSQDEGQANKYHNPFDLSYGEDAQRQQIHQKGVASIGEQSPPKIRKGWGNQAGQGHASVSQNQPRKASYAKNNDDNDEEDYSDSFEDPNTIKEELKEEEEDDYQKSIQKDNAEIEKFLRTATKQEIDQLKQSLGTFGGDMTFLQQLDQAKKESIAKKEEDEYIEEDFEEEIPEDTAGNSDDSEEERKQVEAIKAKQQSQQSQYKTSRTITAGGKLRPISATYSLVPLKVQQTPKSDFSTPTTVNQNVISALKQENSKLSTKPFQTEREKAQVQDTPKQPNDIMKKPINTNPFKRPFSQNMPIRPNKNPNLKIGSQIRKESDSDDRVVHNQTSATIQSQIKGFESSQKSHKKGLDTLLSRIEVLDDTQRDQLLEVLNHIEGNSVLGQSQIMLNSEMKGVKQSIDLDFLSPLKSQKKVGKMISPRQETANIVYNQSSIKPNQNRVKNELIIRILSTFGNPHVCGLTEVELFDEKGKKIPIVPASVSLKNLGQGPIISLERLINNNTLITDDKQMWLGYLPQPPLHLELVIYFNKDKELGGLKIWNYNKSIIDYTKGARDVQILINDEIKWQGQLQGGKGRTDIDYSTQILFKDNVELPQIFLPERVDPIDEIIDEELNEEEENKEQEAKSYTQQQQQPVSGGGAISEELRKYRSELNIKEKPETTPLWLQSNQNAVVKDSQIITERSNQRSQQQEKRQRIGDQEQFNNMSKAQPSQQSTSIGDLSSVPSNLKIGGGGQISLDNVGSNVNLRKNEVETNQQQQHQQYQQQSTPSMIKPNSMIGGVQSQAKIKQLDTVNKQSNNKQWTQPFSVSAAAQITEANEAVKNAVNKVNDIFNKQHNTMKRRGNQKQIEESLDSLEFFKVTNLGRLQNENDKPNLPSQAIVGSSKTNEKPTRQKWGQGSPDKSPSDTVASANKQHAHVKIKNPFPDQQPSSYGKPSPHAQRGTNNNRNQADDILDKFMGGNNDNNIKLRKDPSTDNTGGTNNTLYVKHLPNKSSHQHKASLSPSRDDIKSLIDNTLSSKDPMALLFEDKQKIFTQPFEIPSLPLGQKIQINIVSTWGDMNYVGLTGIEIFDIEGRSIKIGEEQISACPPDINILPGYGSDPRTIDKLVDGHYYTNDDLHGWLAPFTAGDDHTITIDLQKKYQIAMIRIWNYNKSRIHSYRGARLISCELDTKLIFRGEISKSSGLLDDPQNCCEIILFTENNAILNRIDAGDWLNSQIIAQNANMEETQKLMQEIVPQNLEERPMTATKKFNAQEIQDIQRHLKQQKPTSLFDERPQTSAILTGDQDSGQNPQLSTKEKLLKKQQELSSQVRQQSMQHQKMVQGQNTGVKGRVLEFNIVDSWGDQFYTGLNGIEVLDQQGQPIVINMSMVEANPKDMNSIAGHTQDHRTLDKLFNSINNTTNDHNMWLIPFNKGENHTVKIDFGKVQHIGCVKFYNYNKSEEDSLRGVKQVVISLDKQLVTPKKGITLRKAPGLVLPNFDQSQSIYLPYQQGWSNHDIIPMQKQIQDIGIFQEYECLNLPMGFIFKFNLYSTHGDFFYIGLTGIELFDQNGNIIQIEQIYAEPSGVHKLPSMQNDTRTIDKLINGRNQTFDEQDMWLAPFKSTRSYKAANAKDPGQEQRIPNAIYVVFDQPKAISAIRIWNYCKTPNRGVNEYELMIDDKQVYRGFARIAPAKDSNSSSQDYSSVVLFTSNQAIVDKLCHNVNYNAAKDQSVQMYNENKLMNKHQLKSRPDANESTPYVFNEQERPQTMVIRR